MERLFSWLGFKLTPRSPATFVPLTLLALALSGAFASPSFADGPDVNWDGAIDVVDVQRAANIALALDAPTRPTQADLDLDGTVDVADLQRIVNEILGLSGQLVPTVPPVVQRINPGTPWSFRLQATGGLRPHTWAVTGLPSWMSTDATGLVTGTPPYPVLVAFDFVVTDAASATFRGETLLTVILPSNPNEARSDNYSMPTTGPLTVAAPGLLNNDAIWGNGPGAVVGVTQPLTGVVTWQADGSFTYANVTPVQGNRTQFTYAINDGRNGVASATVTIWFGNRSPNVINDAYIVMAGTTLDRGFTAPAMSQLTWGVLDNDQDFENNPMTAAIAVPPSIGVLNFLPTGAFSYTPPRSHPGGVVTFSYSATDIGSNLPSLGTVSITVLPLVNSQIKVAEYFRPLPIRAGVTTTLEVNVEDSAMNSADAYTNVASVVLDATAIGGPANVPLSFVTFTSSEYARYAVSLPVSAAATYGRHELTITATSMTQSVHTRTLTVFVYHGAPVMVGTGGSVQTAVNSASPQGAVILNSFNVTWAPPTGLVAGKPLVIALAPGVDPESASPLNPMIPMAPSARLLAMGGNNEGLNLVNLQFTMTTVTGGPVATPFIPVQHAVSLIGVFFRHFLLSGSGGLVEVSGPTGKLYLEDCSLYQSSSTTASIGPVKGGVVYAHSGASAVIRNLDLYEFSPTSNSVGPVWGGFLAIEGPSTAHLEVSGLEFEEPHAVGVNKSVTGAGGIRGGFIYVDGARLMLHDTEIDIVAQTGSGQAFLGGVLCLVGGAICDVTRCGIACNPVSNVESYGGCIYLAGGSTLVADRCSMNSRNFGAMVCNGGGLAMSSDCLAVIEHSVLSAFLGLNGGAVWCGPLPLGVFAGSSPNQRVGSGRLQMSNTYFGGSRLQSSVGTGESIYMAIPAPAAPLPFVAFTHCTILGTMDLQGGHVTMTDSITPDGGVAPISSNPSLGSLIVMNCFAYTGFLPGHINGVNGNFGSIPFTHTWWTEAESRVLRTVGVDRGSMTAVSRGFGGLLNSNIGVVDVGMADIGARDFRNPVPSGPPVSITAIQLRQLYP